MPFTTFFIDLDETIYPSTSGVWPAISQRMELYMHDRLNLEWADIPTLRSALYHQYGSTLRGLQITMQVDELDFLAFVHDVPLDRLIQPDPALRAVLCRYPQRKLIFTNADRHHAVRVLRLLQLEDLFDGMIDIHDLSPHCKPMTEAYLTALHLAGITDPAKCVFIDDSPRNLEAARAIGFFTIQVGSPKPSFQHPSAQADACIPHLAYLPDVLSPDMN